MIVVILGGLGIPAAAFLVIALDTTDRGLEVFLLAWMAGWVWSAYLGLFRYAYQIGLAGDSTLRWCSVIRCREVPISAIRGISTPWRMGGAGLRRIDVDAGSSPILIASPGLDDVIAMIERSRPDLTVHTALYDCVAARFAKRTLRWRRL